MFFALVNGVAAGRWDELPALYAEDTDVRHPFAADRTAILRGRAELRAHFAEAAGRGLQMSVHEAVVHTTADPEVVIAEFAYHVRSGSGGERFKVPAVFVLRVRDGLIVESRDYIGPRQQL
jgi:ketosteroid isomerase-like protein